MDTLVMDHFVTLNKLSLKEMIKGASAGFIQTENLTIAYTDMKAGAEIPLHHHPEEATDIVLEGELEMQIGERLAILKRGMISIVPSNELHCAKAITDCKVITILHPRKVL